MQEITAEILTKIFPPRKPEAHKYDFGHLLVIGGSKLYSGSPALSALAAYKTGVDLVTVIAPRRAADIVASFSPNMITYPLEGDHLTSNHLGEIWRFFEDQITAVVIGGGLGREEETLKAVVEFLTKIDQPTVIDADAIHAVAREKEVVPGKPFVITPHLHEFYMLTGIKLEEDLNQRIYSIQDSSTALNSTILLKGNVDIICQGEKTALNKTGSPYMTVGGTGDTLAGILGSLLAQKIELFEAACAAAYINGKAGEIAASRLGLSLTATDVIDFIPQVIANQDNKFSTS